MLSVRDEYDGLGGLTFWSGAFASSFEGWASRVPGGYRVQLEWHDGSVVVECPRRSDRNYLRVDRLLVAAAESLRGGA